ncbi:MAG: aldehyde dehydrogenase family protein [Fusobacterium sp.]|uniref:aldehyde dehydrogenase family protein n=1 Tax=Fusobacterium sp. TaxID=68766 RepID=UPI0026DAB271|nr:aldehyde dehydrogenase family protein [Fusobacterium sp.]MDO4691117.1 aldehyde dehydrogenase family protein [Fusobacterium sp.]
MKDNLKKSYKMYINGEWVDSSNNIFVKTYNPYDKTELSQFPDASEEDVDLAVRSAKDAFKTWKKTTVKDRAKILNQIADIIEENKDYLATVETLDNGKPIRETKAVDIPLAADHFRYFAGCILAEEGQATVLNEKFLSLVLREPVGVVGQIIPWNFPFLMAAWKIAPALAAGNTIVIKPSSSTSLSLIVLLELIDGLLPKGVLNLITGKGSTAGEYLKNHPNLDKLAFTGSTAVGRDIALAAAEKLIPATLELGGKSANIILEDANIEKALEGAQLGILFNQGQVCCAGSRIFVQEKIYDIFISKLVKKFENIKIGNPLNTDTVMGAQIDQKQVDKILDYVRIAKEEGGIILTGGTQYIENGCEKGSFVKPTLITNVANGCRISQEEVFGPVAVVIKFKTDEEVIEMANDSDYGLGGAVFTTNINRALNISRAIETGRVWVNTYNQIPEHAPFGGYKKSGIGRETHKIILDHYTQIKNILIDMKDDLTGFYK